MAQTHSARKGAVTLLDKVLGEHRLMSELSGVLESLPAPDRARARRLASDALRGLELADRLLGPLMRKPPPLHVRNVLRVATVELALGGDAHGVVNEAVSMLASDRKHARFKGLANAILRKMARDAQEAWPKLPVPRMPDWLRQPILRAYGPGATAAMEAAHFEGAPLDLTAKGDPEAVARQVGGRMLPTGSIRLDRKGQVSVLPGYEAGTWWVQDAAAALPARLLQPEPGEEILDMCAAPGGKTLQLAAAGADVTALDISTARMLRVRENLDRTGLSATLITEDALEHHGAYDAVLLDAPCSATGTIRRHPDLPHAKTGKALGSLVGLQAKMLDHAVSLLRPGGRLVYCTCSLLPEEGEKQLEAALERHDTLVADPDAFAAGGGEPEWMVAPSALRTRPDYWAESGGLDGFFIACLRRR